MHYVYVLKSINFDQTYVGVTNDLQRRFKEHNSGHSLHTKKFMPWRLISYVAFSSKEKAALFEIYLKTGSGIAFSRKHFL